MKIKQLTPEVSVSGQIRLENLEDITQQGFKSIICNRPDHEDPGQPTFKSIAAEAERLGLEVRHQPVPSAPIKPADARDFAELFDELPKPILAYCRSGTRSTWLYQAAKY